MASLGCDDHDDDDDEAADSSADDDDDEEEIEGCLPLNLDAVQGSGQRPSLSGRHGMAQEQHIQLQSHRGSFMHRIARTQTLENKVF